MGVATAAFWCFAGICAVTEQYVAGTVLLVAGLVTLLLAAHLGV